MTLVPPPVVPSKEEGSPKRVKADLISSTQQQQQPPQGATTPTTTAPSRQRNYRIAVAAAEGSGTGTSKWVTRDIAALDFLLGIPMEAEASTVQAGWMQHQGHINENEEEPTNATRALLPAPLTATGRWWEKFVVGRDGTRLKHKASSSIHPSNDSSSQALHDEELEGPSSDIKPPHAIDAISLSTTTHLTAAPGRRLDGEAAIKVQIPAVAGVESRTRQKSVARQAAVREWEIRVAHGLDSGTPMLNGRVFFSAGDSYPMGVFSVVRYEPKREEAARRRRKLEQLGGGGSLFVMPERDWRGTSYRALLPRRERKNKSFELLLKKHKEKGDEAAEKESDDDMSVSSDESETYLPGFLDDPEMVQGRHRHVMIGDRVTGCIVSSTIQFVKPADLKADLNKQFRERFDGWEPPKSQWKFIGAKVVDGEYRLIDPTEAQDRDDSVNDISDRRMRQNSISTASTGTAEPKDTIRMPPSLTLSKIRAVKKQALIAAVKASLEVSTVALACVYFERLCLDCRVDKSNRRLTFAACLILAAKINESNVKLVMQRQDEDDTENDKMALLKSFIRPTKESDTIFASLLEFFTHDWELSLKHLLAAEWGVFAALGFSLHAKPSQVEFHFVRLMKVLEWTPMAYLGDVMYSQWQESLDHEELRNKEHEQRREQRQHRKERKLLELEHELRLKQDNERNISDGPSVSEESGKAAVSTSGSRRNTPGSSPRTDRTKVKKAGFLKFMSMKRSTSSDRLADQARLANISSNPRIIRRFSAGRSMMIRSPSLPAVSSFDQADTPHVAIDVEEMEENGSVGAMSEGGIIV